MYIFSAAGNQDYALQNIHESFHQRHNDILEQLPDSSVMIKSTIGTFPAVILYPSQTWSFLRRKDSSWRPTCFRNFRSQACPNLKPISICNDLTRFNDKDILQRMIMINDMIYYRDGSIQTLNWLMIWASSWSYWGATSSLCSSLLLHSEVDDTEHLTLLPLPDDCLQLVLLEIELDLVTTDTFLLGYSFSLPVGSHV